MPKKKKYIYIYIYNRIAHRWRYLYHRCIYSKHDRILEMIIDVQVVDVGYAKIENQVKFYF